MSILSSPLWGKVTSTIDWCEPNYVGNNIIAEYWNTLSNFSFVFLGLIGLVFELNQNPKTVPYIVMYGMITLIGIGSFAFHGTLTIQGQLLDELPMVYHLLAVFYIVNRDNISKIKMPIISLLILYGIIFSILHVYYKFVSIYQIHYSILLAILLSNTYIRYNKFIKLIEKDGLKTIYLFIISLFIASSCWLLDYHYCGEINNILPFTFNGHIFWHLFMGYCSYLSVIMLKVLDNTKNNKDYNVKYHFFIPFIYRDKNNYHNSSINMGTLI